MISEKDIEKRLVREVEALGGLCIKYFNPAQTGYPDRLCLLPGGETFWVELKAPGKKLRRSQEIRKGKLEGLGQRVYVADGLDAVSRIVEIYKLRKGI